MKKSVSLLMILSLLFSLTACGGRNTDEEKTASKMQPDSKASVTEPKQEPDTSKTPSSDETETPSDDSASGGKTLVVYFSCTGTTKAVAEKIAELTNADIYEIAPEDPYTDSDLNYNNENCRANREMNDPSARPAIGSSSIDLSGIDTIFIGYPIWWGTMPKIINTFLDTYDLSGKTILPFCTSGSSGISQSVSDLKKAEPDAEVKDGLRAKGASDSSLSDWLARNGF